MMLVELALMNLNLDYLFDTFSCTLKVSWLSANIEYTVTREPYFSTPYTIKMYSDLKIAIVGLTSDGLMKNEYAEMEEDVCIEKTLVSAKRWIRYIHEVEEPDFLIVIYHGGLNKISSTNKRNEKMQMKLKNYGRTWCY